jgi:hypothetical protein
LGLVFSAGPGDIRDPGGRDGYFGGEKWGLVVVDVMKMFYVVD